VLHCNIIIIIIIIINSQICKATYAKLQRR